MSYQAFENEYYSLLNNLMNKSVDRSRSAEKLDKLINKYPEYHSLAVSCDFG